MRQLFVFLTPKIGTPDCAESVCERRGSAVSSAMSMLILMIFVPEGKKFAMFVQAQKNTAETGFLHKISFTQPSSLLLQQFHRHLRGGAE